MFFCMYVLSGLNEHKNNWKILYITTIWEKITQWIDVLIKLKILIQRIWIKWQFNKASFHSSRLSSNEIFLSLRDRRMKVCGLFNSARSGVVTFGNEFHPRDDAGHQKLWSSYIMIRPGRQARASLCAPDELN